MRKVRDSGADAPAMDVFTCTLELPPSVNDWLVPMLVKRGGKMVASVVKSSEAVKWLKSARSKLEALSRPASLHSGVLELEMRVFVPSLASDGGNRLKLPEDAFKALVIDDDRQFVKWSITKDIDSENPRVELVVRHADPLQHPRVAERLARAEKERVRREKKEQAERAQEALPLEPAPKSPAYKTPLPPGSRAGTPSYGSQHAADFKVPPRGSLKKVGQQLRGLATSASHPPRSLP